MLQWNLQELMTDDYSDVSSFMIYNMNFHVSGASTMRSRQQIIYFVRSGRPSGRWLAMRIADFYLASQTLFCSC
jgi:hypothetical protein